MCQGKYISFLFISVPSLSKWRLRLDWRQEEWRLQATCNILVITSKEWDSTEWSWEICGLCDPIFQKITLAVIWYINHQKTIWNVWYKNKETIESVSCLE